MKIFNLVQLLQSDKRENGEEKKIEMQMTPYKISIDGTKQIKTKPRGMYDRYPDNSALVCLIYVASGSVEKHRGRDEADRGRHEAEVWNEDIRYMRFPKGPNSVSLG
ncbi:hypothetical protein T4B_13510 [Trichinella pseudospiralis]|uniref:Uncharacterized protein n=1 Tax=Trichinella pseudospiralis TaxID=6337 RepID=A0A0V1JDQ5_TRIPS|nr:hypothetical protein T4B_13510 [Trichinella pseudospiralis]KRZ32661.1 hypothetical protein T4C_11771 [Trichinella pseudospiralis]